MLRVSDMQHSASGVSGMQASNDMAADLGGLTTPNIDDEIIKQEDVDEDLFIFPQKEGENRDSGRSDSPEHPRRSRVQTPSNQDNEP